MATRKEQIQKILSFELTKRWALFTSHLLLALLISCGNNSRHFIKSRKSHPEMTTQTPATNSQIIKQGTLSPTYDCATFSNSNETVDLCRWVNYSRNQEGLIRMMSIERLNQVAQKHAEEMSKYQYLNHTNRLGQALEERLRLANVPFTKAEEEIAFGYYTGVSVFNFWFNSPIYRSIHIDPKFTRQGLGYHEGYWSRILID